MNRKIIVSEYENGRPCVEVVSDSGEGFILTADMPDINSDTDLFAAGNTDDTLIDLPFIASLDPSLVASVEGLVYRVKDMVEVNDCGKCVMGIAEVLVEPGEYWLADGKLTAIE